MAQGQLKIVNDLLKKGELCDRQGQAIQGRPFEFLVVNLDGNFAYRVENQIVKLIADDAIVLTSNQSQS